MPIPKRGRTVVIAGLFGALSSGCATSNSGLAVNATSARIQPDLRVRNYDADASKYGLFLAGSAAMTQGRSEEAAELLAQASAAAPGDAPLRERAFTANLIAGRTADAASLAPESPYGATPSGLVSLGRLVRAVNAMADGHAATAQSLLRAGVIGPPHDIAARLLAPWAEAQAGAAPPGEVPATLDKNVDDEISLSRARLLERAGRSGEAAAVYRSRLATGASGAAVDLGAFEERAGRRKSAQAIYAAALAKAPHDPALLAAAARIAAQAPAPKAPTLSQGAAEALLAPATSFVAKRQPEFGLIYLRLALHLDPHFAPAWMLVGDALAAGGDEEAAIAAYRRIEPAQQEYAAARGRLAIRLQSGGDKPQALSLAQEGAVLAPDDLAAQVLYAEVLRDDERYDEAIPVLDKAIANHGDEADVGARLHFLRGAVLERAGRWSLAEPDLKRAVAARPNDAEMLNYLGFAWADRGEHLPEALSMLERASDSAPDDGAILDSVGWARFRLGDVRGAVRDLERAVVLTPADPDVNDHLGDAYQRSGRALEAQFQWRRVLTLEPTPMKRAAVEMKLKGAEARTRS